MDLRLRQTRKCLKNDLISNTPPHTFDHSDTDIRNYRRSEVQHAQLRLCCKLATKMPNTPTAAVCSICVLSQNQMLKHLMPQIAQGIRRKKYM